MPDRQATQNPLAPANIRHMLSAMAPPRTWAVVTICWLFLFAPWLDGHHVLPWDAMDQFFPTVFFNAQSLRQGIAPWWNPYIYGGFPQAADPQGMLFSPLMMAWMMIPRSPGAWWFSLGVLLHVWLGGVGFASYLRDRGLGKPAAVLGAVVFMAGGVAASRLEHVPMIVAYGYAGVVLALLSSWISHPGYARGLWLGLAAGMLCVQLTQLTLFLAVWLALIVAGHLYASWQRREELERIRLARSAVLACATAAVVALPQCLLSMAFVALSNRDSLGLAASAPASLTPRALLSLLDPNVLHALRGTYDGLGGDRTESFLYVGALPLGLILVRLRNLLVGEYRAAAIFSLLTLVTASLYFLGVHTPVYPWTFEHIRLLQLFRRPSDAAFLFNLAMAWLAAMAMQTIIAEKARAWVIPALFVFSTVLLGSASAYMQGSHAQWRWESLIPALIAFLCLIYALWQQGHLNSRAWIACVALLMLADYSTFNLNGALNRASNPWRHFDTAKGPVKWLQSTMQKDGTSDLWRIEPLYMPSTWDNGPSMVGLKSTQGYNPLRYRLYDRFYGAREHGHLPRPVTAWNHSLQSRLTDLMGVRYVLTQTEPGGHQTLSNPLPLAASFGTTEIHINPHAYPRLLTPRLGKKVPKHFTPEAFEHTDFSSQVWLSTEHSSASKRLQHWIKTCHGSVHTHITTDRPTAINIDTSSQYPGWIVLNDLYFPGWTAEIDDHPTSIMRANLIFRAICVPAGKHRVRFAFHPMRMIMSAL